MARWRNLFFISIIFLAPVIWAQDSNSKIEVSTTPIGSPFLRHFAYDYNLNLKDLVKFEKRGFGRTEIISLALISQKTGKPMKEYGKRRIKNQVPLKDLAKEAGMDYGELYSKARRIKGEIEAKGDINLPPPIFEEKTKEGDSPAKKPQNDKEKESELDREGENSRSKEQ